ncbi:arylacetamide deacetylase-like 2 [Bolinopsis microptera]|uniref:arylacetamide deacetylase-like 2 n=1 Tax=Bolinopsis microptera TaxID=2820187 RepID=UPI00307A88BD
MFEGGTSKILWLAQSVPLFGLLCYVSYQWRNLLSIVILIASLYSFTKNAIAVVVESNKVPKRAFILLVFFDLWVGLVMLNKYIYLDMKYSRGFLDCFMKYTGKSSATTEQTIYKVNKHVEVYVYKPCTISNKGCVVYIHGGGFCFLSAAGFNKSISQMSHYLEMVVVSVEYRLAPEHRFPAGLIDSYSAVQWVHDNSEMLGVDCNSIFVAGDSAGGNLSAAVSLLYRDRQGAPLEAETQDVLPETETEEALPETETQDAPQDKTPEDKKRPGLAGQILLYPLLQGYSSSHPSMIDNGTSFFPHPEMAMACISMYVSGGDRFTRWLGDPEKIPTKAPKFWQTVVNKDASQLETIKEVKMLAEHSDNVTFMEIMGNSYLLPLHAEDVSNLPPAYITVAAADTLRDEGEWYAHYLRENGNSVELSEVKHVHGFMMQYETNEIARGELMKIKKWIGKTLSVN